MLAIDFIGYEHAMLTLTKAEAVFENPSLAAPEVFTLLEGREAQHFEALHGYYVDTGRLMASLTQPHANGALRAAHGDEIDFGSTLYHARFLGPGPLPLDQVTYDAVAQAILREAVGE